MGDGRFFGRDVEPIQSIATPFLGKIRLLDCCLAVCLAEPWPPVHIKREVSDHVCSVAL